MDETPISGDSERKEACAAVRSALRTTLQSFDAPYYRRIDQEHLFPNELFKVIGDAGYFGTLLPSSYGGADAGPMIASVVVEEINRAGGDAGPINAQMTICGTLLRDGNDEQRDFYLPKVASGELRFLTVAATEPDSGADMSALESRAVRDGDHWVINAKKVLISFAGVSDSMILLVNSDEGPTLFLFDLREWRQHMEIRPIELVANRMTTMLFIDDLRVPDSMRLGPVGSGLKCLVKGFAVRRSLAAAESIGNARFLLDRSLEHAKTRVTFNRPIGQNQGVQYPLAKSYAQVEAADLMRWDALRLAESGHKDAAGRAALAKILASEAAWETARAALTTFGGWGLSREMDVERKLRESMVFVFNNLLLSYVSDRLLGLPKAF